MESKNRRRLYVGIASIFLLSALVSCSSSGDRETRQIQELVEKHARAWEQGDEIALENILSDDVVFAYPGRRLNKQETLEDLQFFKENFTNTKVYIHNIIVDAPMVAVEWQFATTSTQTGDRQVVSDAIIGEVHDGKITLWKEYLDGRVKNLQATGELELEE